MNHLLYIWCNYFSNIWWGCYASLSNIARDEEVIPRTARWATAPSRQLPHAAWLQGFPHWLISPWMVVCTCIPYTCCIYIIIYIYIMCVCVCTQMYPVKVTLFPYFSQSLGESKRVSQMKGGVAEQTAQKFSLIWISLGRLPSMKSVWSLHHPWQAFQNAWWMFVWSPHSAARDFGWFWITCNLLVHFFLPREASAPLPLEKSRTTSWPRSIFSPGCCFHTSQLRYKLHSATRQLESWCEKITHQILQRMQ